MKTEATFLALFLVLCSSPILAQNRGVQARLVSAQMNEVAPGKIFTASLILNNPTDREAEFVDRFELPPGWVRISPPDTPFPIPAQSERVRLIALSVPITAPAGRLEITYLVRNRINPEQGDTLKLRLLVQTISDVELRLDSAPESVIAGEDFSAQLNVINHGNVPVKASLQAKGDPACPLMFSPALLGLAPGESQTVKVLGKTNAKLAKRVRLSATASLMEVPGLKNLANRAICVEVLPKVSGNADPYIRIPGRLTVSAAKDSGAGVNLQAEISGSGAVDELGRHQVDYLIRHPELRSRIATENWDEYRFSYSSSNYDLHLGDRNYQLSPLTERYGYGRGVEANVRNDRTGAGGFHMVSRNDRNYSETGAYVKQKYNDWSEVRLNYLHKDGYSVFQTNAIPANIATVQSRIQAGGHTLDLEAGVSDSEKGVAPAWRAEAAGSFLNGRLSYNLEKTRAYHDFYGYYHDMDSTFGNLSYALNRKLRATFSFSLYDNNLALDPARGGIASRELSFRPGLSYTLDSRSDLSVQYQHIRRRDALLPASFDYTENSVRLGYGRRFGQLTLRTYSDLGLIDNELTGAQKPLINFSLYADYRFSRLLSCSAFTTVGTSRNSGSTREGRTLGASMRWTPLDDLVCELRYAHNEFDVRNDRQRDDLTSTVRYTLPNQQTVTVSGRWSKDNQSQRSETAAYFSYSIPFDLPVGKKHSTGVVRGHVFNADTDLRQPLSRVVVTLDQLTAVTDARGEFVFPSLPPGSYRLRVQQNTIGLDNVTAQPLPQLVEVKKNAETRLDLPVFKSSRLNVRLVAAAAPKTDARLLTINDGVASRSTTLGIEGGLLELSNGAETIRQVTDKDGLTVFAHLHPGKWKVRAYDNNLPENHRLEKAATEIELLPGQETEVDFKAVPRQRTIKLIDQGVVLN